MFVNISRGYALKLSDRHAAEPWLIGTRLTSFADAAALEST
jgi:hypothetical protein